jgi:WhiB family redox-sensing transcriptional regulator
VSPATTRTTCRTDDTTTDRSVAAIDDFVADQLPCRRADPDLWFAESPDRLERAKQLCAHCPIRSGCLDAALDRAEPWGVWGGEIFDQGVVIARKRSRGRPRKNPVSPAPSVVCA